MVQALYSVSHAGRLHVGDAEALISIKYGRLLAPQQLRQLGDVGGDAPGFVAG
jgi:hypothetical protein